MSKVKDLWLANRQDRVVRVVNEHLRDEAPSEEPCEAQPLFGLHPKDVPTSGDVQNLNKEANERKR